MRVFILNTGRCGSTTFIRACQAAIRNYSAAHESRSGVADESRLAYPDQHIEADNRLTFFLGALATRYPEDVYYVHLKRDPDSVARSYFARWPRRGLSTAKWTVVAKRAILKPYRRPYRWSSNIMGAFGNGVILTGPDWNDEAERLAACRLYVRSTNENIAHFLSAKPHIDVDIETAKGSFPDFCERIGAEFDEATATAELAMRYNAS